jgi:hypothetical protein
MFVGKGSQPYIYGPEAVEPRKDSKQASDIKVPERYHARAVVFLDQQPGDEKSTEDKE